MMRFKALKLAAFLLVMGGCTTYPPSFPLPEIPKRPTLTSVDEDNFLKLIEYARLWEAWGETAKELMEVAE